MCMNVADRGRNRKGLNDWIFERAHPDQNVTGT